MSAGLWFIIVSLVIAACLIGAGAVRLGIAAYALMQGASAVRLPRLDIEGARRALLRLQSDLAEMGKLFGRARVALDAIDQEVRAMIRAFSRG
ncbi:MAG: hypothetical protein ACREMP_08355 [Candidatus Tyrphobacter sp.]